MSKEFVPYNNKEELNNKICKCYLEGYYKNSYIFPGTRYVCCNCYDIQKFSQNSIKKSNCLPLLTPFTIITDILSLPCRIMYSCCSNNINNKVSSETNTLTLEFDTEHRYNDIISDPPAYNELSNPYFNS